MDFEISNKSKFNLQTVKNIFSDLEQVIKENVLTLHKSIEEDNNTYHEKSDFSRIFGIIERARDEEWLLTKSTTNMYYQGIGNIGVCYNGNPEIFLYTALKALKTNNNMIFFENDEIHVTNLLLQKFIEKVCKKNKYDTCIKNIQYKETKEFVNDSIKFDMFMFINEQQKYLDFCARNEAPIKIICSNYGTMDLFLADNGLEKSLAEVDEYASKNDIDLEIYKNDTIERVVKKINLRKSNYCAVIYTSNTQEAYYFLENVKAEKVFINQNPQRDYGLYIDDREVTIAKKIFI